MDIDEPMEICQSNSGALNISGALHEQHVCTRNCAYKNEFANVYSCLTSGQIHICDNTCNQLVWFDRYSSICRLSKRIFPNEESPRNQLQRKRSVTMSVHEEEAQNNQGGLKRTCSEPATNFASSIQPF
jgi:hypothetical protein